MANRRLVAATTWPRAPVPPTSRDQQTLGTRLRRRFRAVWLDLAGQRLTSGIRHGPEFGLTPWNARQALGADRQVHASRMAPVSAIPVCQSELGWLGAGRWVRG